MTLDTVDLTIKTLTFALSVAAIVFTWLRTRRQDLDTRLEAGSKRMDEHDQRVSRLEQTVQAMPAKDEMHRLELHLSQMAGDMKEVRASMKGYSEIMQRIESVVTRHEEHLLENRK